MISPSPRKAPRRGRRSLLLLLPLSAALLLVFWNGVAGAASDAPGGAAAAPAAEHGPWYHWWLPEDLSEHGRDMDVLFNWIFWITSIILVLVWAAMIYFCIKYRYRPGKAKAVFTHGNARLEMTWTLVPAVILLLIALLTKKVWDDYRYPRLSDEEKRKTAHVMVIAQQFQWNVVYPGPDGKLGRYLIYPKTTDARWPQVPPGKAHTFPEVPGPAFLPQEQAKSELKNYIEAVNPLGLDLTDAAGKDDIVGTMGEVVVPKGTPIEITLGSKDVLHDFFLPNYRVKLDAVPGLKGLIHFRATRTSEELEKATLKKYTVDELEKTLTSASAEFVVVIPAGESHPQMEDDGSGGRRFWTEVEIEETRYRMQGGRRTPYKVKVKKKDTVVRDGTRLSQSFLTEYPETFKRLRSIGVAELTAYRPKYWDLVCEELCGAGHSKMQGRLLVVERDQWFQTYSKPLSTPPAPTTAPATEPAASPTTSPATAPTSEPATQPATATAPAS